MEQNHRGHLGFLINTILACFDPGHPVAKEQVSAQSDLMFEKRCRNDFQDGGCGGHLGYSTGSISYFVSHKGPNAHHRFNWIIEEMSKI